MNSSHVRTVLIIFLVWAAYLITAKADPAPDQPNPTPTFKITTNTNCQWISSPGSSDTIFPAYLITTGLVMNNMITTFQGAPAECPESQVVKKVALTPGANNAVGVNVYCCDVSVSQ